MEIKVKQGVIKIDDEDAWLLRAMPAHVNCQSKYLICRRRIGGKDILAKLHRLIMSATPGVHVDHINGDRMDNRRSNLRLVNNSQNLQNRRGPQANTTTGFRGVSLDKRFGYQAYCYVSGRKKHLGYFADPHEAAAAARAGREKHMTHSIN